MHPRMYVAFFLDHYDLNQVLFKLLFDGLYILDSLNLDLYRFSYSTVQLTEICFLTTRFWQLLIINPLMRFIAILQMLQKLILLILYTFIDKMCTRYIQLMWIFLFIWKNHRLCSYNWLKEVGTWNASNVNHPKTTWI